jgi:uncharacterized protein (DUF488 family)
MDVMARTISTQNVPTGSDIGLLCLQVFSIGHSSLELSDFLRLLDKISNELVKRGIKYTYLGSSLGGRPSEDEFYDSEGRVDYAKLASSTKFKLGLDKLKTCIAGPGSAVAVMCGEENPSECHRRLLIGRVLAGEGIKMFHIRADGSCKEELTYVGSCSHQSSVQVSLFDCIKENEWKSTRSVSRGEKRKTSSAF